jgi:hypothetical protein
MTADQLSDCEKSIRPIPRRSSPNSSTMTVWPMLPDATSGSVGWESTPPPLPNGGPFRVWRSSQGVLEVPKPDPPVRCAGYEQPSSEANVIFGGMISSAPRRSVRGGARTRSYSSENSCMMKTVARGSVGCGEDPFRRVDCEGPDERL